VPGHGSGRSRREQRRAVRLNQCRTPAPAQRPIGHSTILTRTLVSPREFRKARVTRSRVGRSVLTSNNTGSSHIGSKTPGPGPDQSTFPNLNLTCAACAHGETAVSGSVPPPIFSHSLFAHTFLVSSSYLNLRSRVQLYTTFDWW